ncbi:MAG: VCBS repeat-containing protein, partial [Pedobacter sp.]
MICLAMVVSCSSPKKKSALFTLTDPASTGIRFANNVSYNESFNPYTFRNFFNGAGVGIGDINNDGLADIFFCSNQQDGKLYLNKGNWIFEDITTASGINTSGAWSTGVAMVDVNGDGLLDIYVCKSGDSNSVNRSNSLYINKTPPGSGKVIFEDQASEYNLDIKGLSTHAAFFDYDNDGDLDCYLLTNSFRSVSNYTLIKDQRKISDSLGGNRLLRNDNGHFTDVTQTAGIYSSMIGFGLGVTISDINAFNAKRFQRPIFNGQPAKGIFMRFEDFLANNPLRSEFTVDKNSKGDYLYLKNNKGTEELVTDLWGYCDGSDVYIFSANNYFKLNRVSYSYRIYGAKEYSAKFTMNRNTR